MDKINDPINETTANDPLLNATNETVALKALGGANDDATAVEFKGPEVKDKFKMMYIIFLLHGMAVLLPWNIFMTSPSYFTDFKLGSLSKDDYIRENFLFIISMVGQTSNVIMNAVNTFFRTGNPKGRMPYAIMVCAFVLIATVVLAIINSNSWPVLFFYVTCFLIFVVNLATGVYNTSLFYVASMFPMQCINAIIFGNNLSGIFTTIMAIISKATSPDLRIAAIYYFLSGVVLLLVCFILYFVTPRIRFYRFKVEQAMIKAQEEAKKNVNNEEEPKLMQYKIIFKQNWKILFCIWLTMFSTLTIFPVYQSQIKQSNSTFFVTPYWYDLILCFLTFNVSVTIGNFLTEFFHKPGPKWIVVPVVLKSIVSIVLMMLCNFAPDKRNHIPVLIANDWVYWLISIAYPMISGYLISLLMMYSPKQVDPKYAGTCSMISALVLVFGVVTGINFSRVLQWFVLL